MGKNILTREGKKLNHEQRIQPKQTQGSRQRVRLLKNLNRAVNTNSDTMPAPDT